MYCGNNRNNPAVVSGEKKIGTRYECFKTGIGVGIHLPFDKSYTVRYVPINPTSVYCGTARRKPREYDRMGTNPECLRKGVGVGKAITAKKREKKLKKD